MILTATLLANYVALQHPKFLKLVVGFPPAYGSSFYSLPFLFLILSLAHSKSIITRIMSLPFLVLLGESSYSLYILQKPINTIYTKYISTHLALSPDGRFYVFIALLIVISIISFYLIEKPGKKMVLGIHAYMRHNKDKISFN
jgi:peptidoglycan/LPS O-acetylase OafA/YrhL